MGNKAPRILGSGISYHVRVQCNNREFRFQRDEDFSLYLSIIRKVVKKHPFHLYDYVLMHTHVHLFLMTPGPSLLDLIMWNINRLFSFTYNKRKNRCGHLWMGPYKAAVVDTDQYAMTLFRYFAHNAKKAGIVRHPKDWPWSGYHYYAYGEANPLLTSCPTYLGFAEQDKMRQEIYQQLIYSVPEEVVEKEERWLANKLKRWQTKNLPGRKRASPTR